MTKLTVALTAFVVAIALAGPAAQGMDLGTNFWNLGWHKAGDCFKDVKNVSGDDPWNPQFLTHRRRAVGSTGGQAVRAGDGVSGKGPEGYRMLGTILG